MTPVVVTNAGKRKETLAHEECIPKWREVSDVQICSACIPKSRKPGVR